MTREIAYHKLRFRVAIDKLRNELKVNAIKTEAKYVCEDLYRHFLEGISAHIVREQDPDKCVIKLKHVRASLATYAFACGDFSDELILAGNEAVARYTDSMTA